VTAVDELELVLRNEHADPHHFLGAHPQGKGVVVRAFRPDAERLRVIREGHEPVELERRHPAGLFEGVVGSASLPLRYRLEVAYPGGYTVELDDPYAFLPTLGELDLYLAGEGRHEELYEKLGAHLREVDGITGTAFAVWAPNARSVSVVGDFNSWDGRLHPMRTLGPTGIWELFVPGSGEGARYKFEIHRQDGGVQLRADPLAFATEMPPSTASVVYEPHHEWQDEEWLQKRHATVPHSGPMSIYEVHVGSWRQGLNYAELGEQLGAYVRDMGFTHVELMPVMEHPFGGSWGYQVTSFFAPTARFGGPDDYRTFVDCLHRQGIGVILDWVPAHFPRDEWALARFDGTPLYEHSDPRRGEHPDWGTYVFNLGRNEVRNFLLASALYWL
jgi:1,4-alpha-glucan branching enzyme